MNFFKKVLIILLASFFIFQVFGCGADAEKTGYDGKVYDISLSGNGSAVLTVNKVGGGYVLTISGSGKVVDYAKKEQVPWNVVLKKVSSVIVEDGVKNIGDYYFYDTTLKEFTLPQSVESVGEHSFSNGSVIYSYAQAEFDTSNTIYYYSAEKPYAQNKYFRIVDGVPRVWREYSVLFIGNSFTFRQGSEEQPAVPYFFENIASSLGETVNVDFVVKSSYTLTKYANKSDEKGKIVEEKLTHNQYDFIVLQEQSVTPVNSYANFEMAVGQLVTRIGTTQQNAEIYLYATWGYPAGLEKTNSKSVAEMNSKLKTAYQKCAAEYNLKVTYVGDAFSDIYTNHKEIELYAADEMHQSNVGAYLSACCHVCSMLNIDVKNATFLGEYSVELCKILQQTAYSVCFVE